MDFFLKTFNFVDVSLLISSLVLEFLLELSNLGVLLARCDRSVGPRVASTETTHPVSVVISLVHVSAKSLTTTWRCIGGGLRLQFLVLSL